jgi:hypothetical protein
MNTTYKNLINWISDKNLHDTDIEVGVTSIKLGAMATNHFIEQAKARLEYLEAS